jgi:CTP:molybdopterin cytidylyltransferase MocA
MTDLTPIVLAAGASSRMGRPKALLDFDGRAALDLVLDALHGHLAPVVVLGPNHEEIRGRVALGAARVALNPDVDSGQTASLKAALALLPPESPAFFFMPVDVPLVAAADVARLVEAFRKNADPGKAIFIPSHAMKRGHPVLCRRELAAEFFALPSDAPARNVMNRSPARIVYVDFPEPYVLMDMDRPEDYVRCLEAYRVRNGRKP